MSEPTLRTLLSAGSLRQRARWALRLVSPWGLEWWLYQRGIRRSEVKALRETPRENTRVEEAVRFLVNRGLDEHQIRAGSVPGDSLSYISSVVFDSLPANRPVRALHVGNFVGVSLCYVSWMVRERHPESVVVSIDPNISHRWIDSPEDHALALLEHFGLLANNVIIRGYTLSRAGSVGTPDEASVACEHVLSSLGHTCEAAFDLVLIDGNHQEAYVEQELAALQGLLADKCIVVFDDIVEWEGVAKAFGRALQGGSFVELGQDGRVGILQVRSADPAERPGAGSSVAARERTAAP